MRSSFPRLVAGDCAYAIFPEGTRSRTGEMAAFKPGIGMLVAGTDVPVVPCGLQGAFAAWRPEHRLPRWKKVRLRIGPPLRFADTENQRRGWQDVAAKTEEAVTSLVSEDS